MSETRLIPGVASTTRAGIFYPNFGGPYNEWDWAENLSVSFTLVGALALSARRTLSHLRKEWLPYAEREWAGTSFVDDLDEALQYNGWVRLSVAST